MFDRFFGILSLLTHVGFFLFGLHSLIIYKNKHGEIIWSQKKF